MCSTGFKKSFQLVNCSKVTARLASILKIIDLTTFFYIRINKNQLFFILSNNKNIDDYLLKKTGKFGNLISNLAKTSVSGKISIALWENYKDDAFLSTLYQLNIWNGISIALPFSDYVDIFSFGASIQHTHLKNFYLNHLYLLKRFIVFFRLKAKKIITFSNNNLYTLNEEIELFCQSTQNEILKKIVTIHQIFLVLSKKN